MHRSQTAGLVRQPRKRWVLWVIGCLAWCASAPRALAAPIHAAAAQCAGTHETVSRPLTDLGPDEYVRMDGAHTGQAGGLYPGGSNTRPAEHEAAGLALANAVVPLDAAGRPDPAQGRIVLLAIGMSNTTLEFREFRNQIRGDTAVNPQLVAVSGAAAGQVAERWLDPEGPNWQHIAARLKHEKVTEAQVQVAWVKLTRTGGGDFPEKAQLLQNDLGIVARNLLQHYPNLKLIYFSSRARAFQYWHGLSPEPAAFETGFAVKWLIEQQIAGAPDLNYQPANGPVVAPWLSWGPYLWIDGLNPRSDGRVWDQGNLIADCTHPSAQGLAQVADMLYSFFSTDVTAQRWFLAEPPPVTQLATPLPPTPTPVAPDDIKVRRCNKTLRQCVR